MGFSEIDYDGGKGKEVDDEEVSPCALGRKKKRRDGRGEIIPRDMRRSKRKDENGKVFHGKGRNKGEIEGEAKGEED